ncbi:MAG: DUF4366 domain-containing protein [bacterium]|nr:DUF4366 domain-containing protein [bacterium]
MKTQTKKTVKLLTLFFLIVSISAASFMPASAQQYAKIASVETNRVRIDWGTRDGMVNGTILDVYQIVDIKHPVTGEIYGSNEKIVGQIEIVDSSDDHSFARILNSTEQIKIGNIARISFDTGLSGMAAGQEYDKGSITSVNNKIVNFNMGGSDGVEENLLFDIFRNIGASTHPVTGEQIPSRDVYIGKLIVTNIKARESTGQIIAQERDIIPGDKILLSLQQASDLELYRQQPVVEEETAAQRPEVRQEVMQQPGTLPETISAPGNVVGTVTRVSDNDVFFIWRGDYGFNAGRIFGIYRRETLRHPETDEVIGNPLILIGKTSLVESIGELGRSRLLSSDADILPQDLIGLTEGETVQSGQIVTPENTEEVFTSQRSDILQQAQALTDQVRDLQAEMTVVRGAIARLDRIDRELAATRVMTQQLGETLNDIKMILLGEGIPLEGSELRPSETSIERLESRGTGPNVLRIKYTDDIDVNFEVVDKSVLISLEVDSSGMSRFVTTDKPAETTPQRPVVTEPALMDTSTIPAESEEDTSETGELVEEGGIPTWLIIVIIVLAVAALGGAGYLFMTKKKKGGSVEMEEDDSGLEGDDDEEGEGDGGGDEDEIEDIGEDAEDFLADDEEEITALDEDDDDM